MNDKIKTSPYRYEKFTAVNDYAFKKIFGTEEKRQAVLILKSHLQTGKKSISKCKICGSTIMPSAVFIIGRNFLPKTLNEAMIILT